MNDFDWQSTPIELVASLSSNEHENYDTQPEVEVESGL